jgi:hypothetical protein
MDKVANCKIVQEDSTCRELLHEALQYHLLVDRRSEMSITSSRLKPRTCSGKCSVDIDLIRCTSPIPYGRTHRDVGVSRRRRRTRRCPWRRSVQSGQVSAFAFDQPHGILGSSRDEWKKLCCLPYAVSKHAIVASGKQSVSFSALASIRLLRSVHTLPMRRRLSER